MKYPKHNVKNDLMNETFISTLREGEKLLLKNSTYKIILKEDESLKKEAVYINEIYPNYDVTTTEVTKLKKPQKKQKMVEILTNDIKIMLNYKNAKKVDIDKLKISQKTSKDFEVCSKKHTPVKNTIPKKFTICKDSKTNYLISNTTNKNSI